MSEDTFDLSLGYSVSETVDDNDEHEDRMFGRFSYSEIQQMVRTVEIQQEENLRERTKLSRQVFWLLLISKTTGSFTFLSIYGNLYLFLNLDPIHWNSDHATAAVAVFYFFTYFFAIIFGWFADTRYTRARVILFSYIFTIVGTALFCVIGYGQSEMNQCSKSAQCSSSLLENICFISDADNVTLFLESHEPNCQGYIYTALIVLSVGTGSLFVNLPLLTYSQIKLLNLEARTFVNSFNLSAAFGSVFCAMSVCYIQQNISFFYGYLIALGSILLSFLFFILGYSWYDEVEPCRDYIYNIINVIRFAFSPTGRSRRREMIRHGQYLTRVDIAMERFRGPYADHLVDEVRILLQIIPVFAATIPFWILNIQTLTSFLTQGLHMRIAHLDYYDPSPGLLGKGDFKLPAVWFSFTTFAVIIVLSIGELLLTPLLSKRGWSWVFLKADTRILVGLVFTSLSLFCAGCLEYARINDFNQCLRSHSANHNGSCIIVQFIGSTEYHATDISINYQLPQMVLMGFGQFLTVNGCLEFVFLESPKNMKGLILGLEGVMVGVGFLLASLITYVATWIGWFCNVDGKDYCNPNSGKLYNYFWALCVMQLIFLFVYYAMVSRYRCFRRGETYTWCNFIGAR